MVLAAQGDTWGIPGPTFLIFYIGAIVAIWILAAIHRRILFAGTRGTDVERLSPQQIAYLNGGDRLVVYAALGGLRAAGAISSAPDKTLYQSGPMPSEITPIDTAVYHAAGRRIRARDIITDQWVAAALRELREGLEYRGLAVSTATMQTARRWAVAGAVVTVLGIARLLSGIGNDKPVTFLIPAIIIAGILSFILVMKTQRATRAAQKGLLTVRRRHQYLAPQQSPSYATYGAAGAAMGVALFGTASIYTMDPAFAAEAEIQRINSSGMTGGSGDSGSGGGSSSCGGGGGGGGGGGCGGGCGG
jgi:uncharacterized protein (TIGR04222 family)